METKLDIPLDALLPLSAFRRAANKGLHSRDRKEFEISWLAENDVYETFASKDATMTISVFKQSRRILHEPDNWAFFLTAMKRMKALPRSLHVVSVLGFVRDTEDTDDVLALIEERPRDVCTLDTWLQRHAHISIRDIASLCRDIARGLAHLHAHLGAHKHLSPRSIQVHTHHHPEHQHYASASSSVPNTRVSAAVGDVHLAAGISCSVPSVPRYYDPDFDFGMRDDPRDFVWHAPETFGPTRSCIVDEKSDVYSLGMLGWTLVTHEAPFAKNVLHNVADVAEVVKEFKQRPDAPGCASDEALAAFAAAPPALQSVLRLCWSFERSLRPRALDVVCMLDAVLSA